MMRAPQTKPRMATPASMWRDTSGISLVEFAFIIPVLVAILLGAVELSHALMVDRKVTNAAQAVGDLVSQRETFGTAADLAEVNSAAELVIAPFSPAFAITIVHVPYDVNGNPDTGAQENWQESINGGRTIPAGEITTQVTGLGAPSAGVVMVELTYAYSSLIGTFILPATTIVKVVFVRPRKTRLITHI